MKKQIKINSPYIKLDSFLKYCGISATGGEAKIIIKNEQVLVNQQICTMRGKKLYKGDNVSFKDKIFEVG